jgi:peptidyl-dipeptidase Dcp
VAKINGELASYFLRSVKFIEENNEYVALNNQGDFDGLQGLRKAAMAQAKEKFNVLGVIGNTRSFVEPFLTLAMTGN